MVLVILLLLALVLGLPAAGILTLIDDAPAVAAAPSGPEETRHVRELGQRLRRAVDSAGNQAAAVAATEAELNSVLRLGAQAVPGLASRVAIDPSGLRATATLPLPNNPIGRFANLTAAVTPDEGEDGPAINVHIGRIGLPGSAAGWVLARLVDAAYGEGVGAALVAALDGATFERGRVALRFRADPALVTALKAGPRTGLEAMMPDLRPVEPYYQRLVETGRTLARAQKVSLHQYLGPLFQLARERATPESAAEENRAALIALAALFGDTRFERAAGAPPAGQRPDRKPVALGGRHDFMQHFVISAGLAATGGTGIADAIGVLKEVDDSRHGTGFSFTDIAADRAGVRFAEAALDPARARRLQDLLARGGREDAYFPKVADLPEFLDEPTFKRRFGAVDSPAYRKVVEEIGRRLDALPVHRGG